MRNLFVGRNTPFLLRLRAAVAPPAPSYIDHAPTLAMRNSLVASHGIGSDPIKGFTGISDTTGFVEYICTTGEEFYTAMAANQGIATTRKLIKLRWNGVQNWASSSYLNGPGGAAMAPYANAAALGGYDVPPHATKIVADAGYSPIFGSTGISGGEIIIRGWGRIDIQGVHFQKGITLSSETDRPATPVLAVSGCTFNTGILTQACHTLHLVNNVFDGPTVGCALRGLCVRLWDNEVKNKNKLGDLFIFHGYSNAIYSGKNVHAWVAGTVLHSGDDVTEGANHYDFVQYGVGSEAYASFNMLGEFNLANSNMPATQGVFGDASGTNQIVRQLWHNNLVLVNAYHGITVKDPSGTGELRAYRNHVMRAATPPADGVDNPSARIMFFKATAGQNPTTAVYDIRENYYNSVSIGAELAANTTSADNIIVEPNPGPANYIGNLFTGNGTFGVNGLGRGNYADPGKGLSKAAAKTAMRDFFQPIGGYRVAGAGMTDPTTWPVAGAAW